MKSFENIKRKEEIIRVINDAQHSYVIGSGIMPLIRAVPILGDMISTSVEKALEDFQIKKQKQLIECILENEKMITEDKVNNIEFIINFSKTVEAVKRLATNDKIIYFGNLLRNGYLSEKLIDNNDFEEYSNIINELSYKEIKFLSFAKLNSKNNKISGISKEWQAFCDKFIKEFNVSRYEVTEVFTRLKRTGFIEELYITQTGEVNDNEVEELEIDGNGYTFTKSFDKFSEMVLNIT